MIKFYLRTSGKRRLDRSFAQLTFELLLDKNNEFAKIYEKQLRSISDTDIVLLEDDIILCDNFENKIKEVISRYPNKIINFFNYPTVYNKVGEDNNFYYNQCVYIPKELIIPLADAMHTYKWSSTSKDTVNKLMRYALAKLKLSYIVYKPCLVQHIDDLSLIWKPNIHADRRSPFFIDYLNKLNIPFEEANTEENLHKLYNLMEEKFKPIDSIHKHYTHNWYATCNWQFKQTNPLICGF